MDEEFASLILGDGEGLRLSPLVRLATFQNDDPRLEKIGELERELQTKYSRCLIYSWYIRRLYSTEEIRAADLFQLDPLPPGEISGELSGTVYDESLACALCGAGGRQISPLRLPFGRLPKSQHLLMTIGNELIVSDKLFDVLSQEALTGARFEPLRQARGASRRWFQLKVDPPYLDVHPSTRCGETPFDLKPDLRRCPNGDTLGLNILSELSVWAPRPEDRRDFMMTSQHVGWRSGVLRPRRLLVVSPRVRELIVNGFGRGVRVEVARLIERPSGWSARCSG